MPTLTIKLKQHTPLILFQHDQEGATLRASEVKPKLDKFVLTKLKGSEKYDQGVKEGWIKNKNGKEWLDYKMKIEVKNDDFVSEIVLKTEKKNNKWITFWNSKKTIIKDGKNVIVQKKETTFPFLMANMGGKNAEEDLMNFSYYKKVEITISSKSVFLSDTIYNNICSFFALNNFGQRQDKGFGSFTVTNIKKDDQEETIEWLKEHKNYYKDKTPVLEYQLFPKEDSIYKYNMLFSVLDFYWKCLKSGVNYTERVEGNPVNRIHEERYIKSFLWTYLNNKSNDNTDSHLTWEKRKIKTAFSLETLYPSEIHVDNNHTAIFARGMMGCPDSFTYFVPQNIFETDIKTKKKVEKKIKYTINIENVKEHDHHDGIQRIPSPIIFKPVIVDDNKVKVYILFDETIIKKLSKLSEDERKFRFLKNNNRNNPIEISIDSSCINFRELIENYHRHFFTNDDYIASLWGSYENGEWQSAKIEEKFDPETRQMKKYCYGIDISNKMIPRSNKWANILEFDSNDKDKDKYVTFSQI